MGVIYAIQAIHGGPIKIGYVGRADGLPGRLRTLQVGNPHRLHVVSTREGTTRDERELHWRFSRYQMSGEWFLPAQVVADEFGARAGNDESFRYESIYDEAHQVGWERGFDDANSTEADDTEERDEKIVRFESAMREWVVRGDPWAHRAIYGCAPPLVR